MRPYFMQNALYKTGKVSRKSILKNFLKANNFCVCTDVCFNIISKSYALAHEKVDRRQLKSVLIIFFKHQWSKWFRFWLAEHIVMNGKQNIGH